GASTNSAIWARELEARGRRAPLGERAAACQRAAGGAGAAPCEARTDDARQAGDAVRGWRVYWPLCRPGAVASRRAGALRRARPAQGAVPEAAGWAGSDAVRRR